MLRTLLLGAATSSLLLGTGAAVHTHLVKAEPGVDSTVKVASTQIRPQVALSAALSPLSEATRVPD